MVVSCQSFKLDQVHTYRQHKTNTRIHTAVREYLYYMWPCANVCPEEKNQRAWYFILDSYSSWTSKQK